MAYAIGLDIGGTKTEGILINDKGEVINRKRVLTEVKKGKKHVIDTIVSLCQELATKPVKGIGIGMPGYIVKGKLLYSPNMRCLQGENIESILRTRLKKSIFIENDANCFTIAESRWGAAKNHNNVVGLIIGTGVGSGILIDGKIYDGANGGIELGHVKFPFEDFDIESLVSGPAIERRYKERTNKTKLASEIFALKDKDAKEVIAETTELLGWLCSCVINILNPEVIVFGGGVSKLPLYPGIRKAAKKYSLPENFKNCLIVKNKLGASSGVLGAASLVFS